jgi:hypothetical protein
VVAPAVLVLLWMLSLALKNDLDNSAYPPVFIRQVVRGTRYDPAKTFFRYLRTA